MLEVYYRHLPIYSGYQFVEGVGKTMDPDAKPDPTAPVTDADLKPAGDKASGAEPGEPMIDPIEAPGTPPPRGSATRTKS
jgi:hypothetical protein